MTDTHPASTDNPACQSCGGEIQGWTCQGCGQSFRENDAGRLVMDRPAPIEPGVTRDALKSALVGSMGWPHDLHPGPAADAILALLSSNTEGQQ